MSDDEVLQATMLRHRKRRSVYYLLHKDVIVHAGDRLDEGRVLNVYKAENASYYATPTSPMYAPLADGEDGFPVLLQCQLPVHDGDTIVVYEDVDTGCRWARPKDEFVIERWEPVY